MSSPESTTTRTPGAWLLLTHHLPPEPAYFRVKVRRRLERIGAVALKNSVYVLPNTAETLEDFQWLAQQIRREGGDVTVCEAGFLDTETDDRLLEQFATERDAVYRDIVASARALEKDAARTEAPATRSAALPARARRLKRRLEEASAVDFFDAGGRLPAEHAVAEASRAVLGEQAPAPERQPVPTDGIGRGRTWVTRRGIKVDRIASAWLIRRFIDPDARFCFVPPQGYETGNGELLFDMFEGEFTHLGDACTFETLRTRFGLDDPALAVLSEIVHDIDCKDDKFGRSEVSGVASLIDGIARRHDDDEDRLARGEALFDDLYLHFSSVP